MAGELPRMSTTKKLQSFKDQRYRLDIEAEEHTKADHDYKLTLSRVFSITRRIASIFERSEPHEKRMLLNFLLQNPTVDGKKLEFTLRKPFDTVLELANRPTGFHTIEDVRTGWCIDKEKAVLVETAYLNHSGGSRLLVQCRIGEEEPYGVNGWRELSRT